MSASRVVTLDVRPVLAAGQEPFGAIMSAVEPLEQPGDQLVLIAPFEPAPLYGVMDRQGFDYDITERPDGAFEVRFTRR